MLVRSDNELSARCWRRFLRVSASKKSRRRRKSSGISWNTDLVDESRLHMRFQRYFRAAQRSVHPKTSFLYDYRTFDQRRCGNKWRFWRVLSARRHVIQERFGARICMRISSSVGRNRCGHEFVAICVKVPSRQQRALPTVSVTAETEEGGAQVVLVAPKVACETEMHKVQAHGRVSCMHTAC